MPNKIAQIKIAQISTSYIKVPFYYGWVVIFAAFVLMALGVNARTAFSLLLPPILTEFKWDRGITAGAFSFGFLLSAFCSPLMGRLMDSRGPRFVALIGVATIVAGLFLATLGNQPWHLYATLGVLVGAGSVCLGYTGQSLYLPNWFVERRGLAMGIAFSGVGIGSIVLLPWMQVLIGSHGWRYACSALAIVVLILGIPLAFLLRRKPQDIGLLPDGAKPDTKALKATDQPKAAPKTNVIDKDWVAIDWTLQLAMRTRRFWWLASGYFCMMFAWYAVQVHQTKYLVETGFSAKQAAWALGAVSLAGIPGQIALGALSDRIGREIVWLIANMGFVATYVLLLVLGDHPNAAPSVAVLYSMILTQGLLGYGATSVFGAIPVEIFEGKHYGSIFGTLMLIAISGGAFGPFLTGAIYDYTNSYVLAFWIAIACSLYACVAIYQAAPGKVRCVAGRR